LRAGAALDTLSSWVCSERSEHSDSAATRRGEARCAGGARLLRRRGCAKEQGEGARGLHAGALDLLRAAGRDGRARSRRGKKNDATRGCKDTANAHDGREDGDGERGRGELTSADERRRSGGTWLRRRFGEVGGQDRDEGRRRGRKIWARARTVWFWRRHGRLKVRRVGLGKKHSVSCVWDHEQRRRRSTRARWARWACDLGWGAARAGLVRPLGRAQARASWVARRWRAGLGGRRARWAGGRSRLGAGLARG
jgi:hypothetical protein